MKTGFIGAGKVGFSLGKLFAENGIQVTGYFSRQAESASEAAAFTNSQFYDDVSVLIKESDAIFITVPDGTIREVYDQIRQYDLRDKQICHCSGAMTVSEAFPDVEELGANGYSIHPLFPVSSKYEAYRKLPDAFFCLEGKGPGLEFWKRTLENIGCRTLAIPPCRKMLYHAACVFASNLVCGLIEQSTELLGQCGLSREDSLAALQPLAMSNINRVFESGPVQALTGPVERGDVITVKKHLESFESDDVKRIYSALSNKLVDIAKEKHPGADYREMRKILKDAEDF